MLHAVVLIADCQKGSGPRGTRRLEAATMRWVCDVGGCRGEARAWRASPCGGRLGSGMRCVCGLGEIRHDREERCGLADEEPVGGEGFECAHRSAEGFGWADDRAFRELAVEEDCWFGHDQVGLQELA